MTKARSILYPICKELLQTVKMTNFHGDTGRDVNASLTEEIQADIINDFFFPFREATVLITLPFVVLSGSEPAGSGSQ